jgi:hypothetical protein
VLPADYTRAGDATYHRPQSPGTHRRPGEFTIVTNDLDQEQGRLDRIAQWHNVATTMSVRDRPLVSAPSRPRRALLRDLSQPERLFQLRHPSLLATS